MNVEVIEAFREVAKQLPNALLLIAGQEWDNGDARRKVVDLGLATKVRFLGRQPLDQFLDAIAICDVALSLRRPPTDGESSAALLDVLRSGVPTIVNNVGTFANLPDRVAHKILWRDQTDTPEIARAMIDLGRSPTLREQLAENALTHIRERHSWQAAADIYASAIDRAIVNRQKDASQIAARKEVA